MGSPIVNLTVFVVVVAAAVALWWPGLGLLALARRRRSQDARIMMEDALKHIHHGEYLGQTASLSSVGGALQIGPDAVVELVRRMQQAGLVTITDTRLLLTESGKRYALQIIRAHRLWERYLADETGVEPIEWHALAERREHTLSPEDADELARRLGDPRFDPHGDPIPTRDGTVPEKKIVALSELEVGRSAHVVHIEDEPDVVYAQLLAAGVYLGMIVRLEEKGDTRIVVDADGRSLVLAPIVAANVSIQRLLVEEPTAEHAQKTLAELSPGGSGTVIRISPACRGIERRRLMDLGIVPGTHIEFERRGLTGGLAAYRLRDTVIALREEQAEMIAVEPTDGGERGEGVAP
jgi:DtxR family Mn-dependent transcriptional regulator